MRHVVIGGGIAGTTAAEELRKLSPNAEITLVSQEFHPLYSRVLLPHYLKSKIPRERVFLKKESWYHEQNIEWLAGISVVALDGKNKFVALSDGRKLSYDKLLIATGGELRTLPCDKRGVSYLRTLDDADHLNQLLGERRVGARGGIYGGGFIACEYLNIFAHYGLRTTIAFRGPHFWSGILEQELGIFINQYLIDNGVNVQTNAAFVDTIGKRDVEGFVTSNGACECSILGIGIGIAPEDEWLKVAGLKTDFGIECNEFLETNFSDIYAAGDVAYFFDVNVGRHVTVGNWMNAQMQGRAVAKNMVGGVKPFSLVSSYATNALGLEIIFVGDTSRKHADDVRVIGSAHEGGIGQLFSHQNRLIGAVLLNRNTDRPKITKAIQDGKSAEDVGD